MPDVILFCGPTLSAADAAAALPGATCEPPAAQGDVLRAALRLPRVIGIIDGYFERVPSVWHKEILWAMSRGIHVFGSASMGALRASELDSFGMRGVGWVYEAFRRGELEDDDEVAVTHAPADRGYASISESLVNIRSTLQKARQEGVIGDEAYQSLVTIAKETFYKERTYPHLLRAAVSVQTCAAAEIDSLRTWLASNAGDQKREDALEMVRTIRTFLEGDPPPLRVSFWFEETIFWRHFQAVTSVVVQESREPDAIVLTELKKDPSRWLTVRTAALAWWMLTTGRTSARTVQAAQVLSHSADFCSRTGLEDSADVEVWRKENHCTQPKLDGILEASTLADAAWQESGVAGEATLLAYLRWTGEYAELLKRARDDDVPEAD